MNKARALCLGITSGLAIACGVLIGVLTYMLGATILSGFSGLSVEAKYVALKNLGGPYWLVALMYVVPGVLCFIAAFVQNKCFYIIVCIITAICVAIMGLVIGVVIYPMSLVVTFLYNLKESCNYDTDEAVCVCREENGITFAKTPFKDCDYLYDTVDYFIAVVAFIAIAWLFLFAVFIITIVYACRSKQTTGAVYTPAQQPMLTH